MQWRSGRNIVYSWQCLLMSKLKTSNNQSDNVRQVPLGLACSVVWHLTWLCFVLFTPFNKCKLRDGALKILICRQIAEIQIDIRLGNETHSFIYTPLDRDKHLEQHLPLLLIEGGDKWVMSKFRWTTILRPFFENPKGPPLDVEKKNSLNQVFIKAMLWHLFSQFQNGITLGYCKYFF